MTNGHGEEVLLQWRTALFGHNPRGGSLAGAPSHELGGS